MTDLTRVAREYEESGTGVLGTPVYRTIADVEPEAVTWLSPGRIPLGKITVLEGDPNRGKSLLMLELTARFTRGQGFPGDPAIEPADVVILTAEDGVADTVRPRLEAAGADRSRVHVLEAVRDADGRDQSVVLPAHVPPLQQLVEKKGAQLVIVDVLMAYLSGAIDSHRDQDIRGALLPLKIMAEETGCAVVVIRHFPKTAHRSVVAGSGSIGIGAAARSVLVVDDDPADPNHRVLASVKSNLAAPPPSLSFRIVSDPEGRARIEWLGQSQETGESLAAARATRDGVSGGATKEAELVELLQDWLGAEPMEKGEVLRLARQSGYYSDRTVERAANRLRVHREQRGFAKEKRSYWSLRPTSTVNPANEPIDKNGGTIDEVGKIADSKALTAQPSTRVSSITPTVVGGTIDGNGARPIPPEAPAEATEEEKRTALIGARVAILRAMGEPEADAQRRADAEAATWGRFDMFCQAEPDGTP